MTPRATASAPEPALTEPAVRSEAARARGEDPTPPAGPPFCSGWIRGLASVALLTVGVGCAAGGGAPTSYPSAFQREMVVPVHLAGGEPDAERIAVRRPDETVFPVPTLGPAVGRTADEEPTRLTAPAPGPS